MIRLYSTIGSGNCFKPQLLMQQLGLDYETIWIDVLGGETRSPEYKAINPNGTVPYLKLDDGTGIAQSNAMLWYLGKGSRFFPQTAYDEALAIDWMIYEQTKLEPFISPARFFTTIVPEKRIEMADSIAGWQAEGAKGLANLNAFLAPRDFILGDTYSIADIAVYGYVHVAEEGGFDLGHYRHVQSWCHRVASIQGHIAIVELAKAA